MKIDQLLIKGFHQFEHFKLDLTYPKGHDREGQALDKICFIGQSGTGKTTILEMIKTVCLNSRIAHSFNNPFKFSKEGGAIFSFQAENQKKLQIALNQNHGGSMSNDWEEPVINKLLYFPIGLGKIQIEDLPKQESTYQVVEEPSIDYLKKDILFFELNEWLYKEFWKIFYQEFIGFREKEANFRINLTLRAENGETINIKEAVDKWKSSNPNPIQKVANECLDKILNKFHLEVQTEIDTSQDRNILKIRSIPNQNSIPYDKLSTGTKQIILTAFPLYKLISPKLTSIILMDEPETSLYPDIQQELIPFYTSFDQTQGQKAQFFFATHSPIIASSFEPWEIVELKFNSEGKVFRKEYYYGENHVENYRIDARYLKWDDILLNIFDLSQEGNMNYRSEKMLEYTMLKNTIDKLKAQGKLKNPSKETKKIVADFKRANHLLTGKWAKLRYEEN